MKVYLVDDTRVMVLAPTRDKAREIAISGYQFNTGTGLSTFVKDDVRITEIDISTDKDFLLLLINEGPDALANRYAFATKRRAWEFTPRGGLKCVEDYREGA